MCTIAGSSSNGASCKVTKKMLDSSSFVHVPDISTRNDYDLRSLLRSHDFHESKATLREKAKVGLKADLSDLKKNERLPLLWILHFLKKETDTLYSFYVGNSVRFHSSKGMPAKMSLRPFLSNLAIFPDGSILRKQGNALVPIFNIEVHSGTYISTVCKTISNLIDMYRMLRLYDDQITEVFGFVFPRVGTDTGVTKVTVQFNVIKLIFEVNLKQVIKVSVKKELLHCLKKARQFCVNKQSSLPFFLRLSEQEMITLQSKMELTGTMTQIPTPQNMLFHVQHEDNLAYYYKYIIEDRERVNVLAVLSHLNPCAHAVQQDPVLFWGHWRPVLKLPILISPLRLGEAQSCLYDFVKLTSDAIMAIHKLQLAHMDIRVPNVCFDIHKKKLIAKFIDFDRLKDIAVDVNPSFEGEMYKIPDGGNCGNLDWKQLGLLVKTVTEVDDDFLQQDPLCVSLIDKGKSSY